MSLFVITWIQADPFVTILLGVALIGSIYLFQHLLLEFRAGNNTASVFTFRETTKALAIAASLSTLSLVFVCAMFSINLSAKITGLKEVFFLSVLSVWFMLPLIAYAVLYVRERNRVLNPGSR
jgi:hypothetical protein